MLDLALKGILPKRGKLRKKKPRAELAVPAASFVYFIRDSASGLIKIGRSNDPEKRTEHLQCHMPGEARLLCAIPGGARLEHTFHLAFSGERRRGEWFQPTEALRALVAELSEQWKPWVRSEPKRPHRVS